MMNKKISLVLFAMLALFSACDNELDLTADYEDIPIIYGKIAVGEEYHYVRVEKAFSTSELNAFNVAQIADSLYYENVIVQLQNLDTEETYTLNEVNGDDIGLPRDTGIFASSPNILYRIKASELALQGEESIRLNVIRGDNLPPVTATTYVLPKMDIAVPNSSPINAWPNNFKLEWRPQSDSARLFDIFVTFNFAERIDDQVVEKSISFKPYENYERIGNQNRESVTVSGDNFYSFIQNSLRNEPKRDRFARNVEFTIIGGGTEILNFFSITLANQGITGSQDVPVFTNLSEGRGIFSSVSRIESSPYTLASDARDSLLRGRFTKDLGFK